MQKIILLILTLFITVVSYSQNWLPFYKQAAGFMQAKEYRKAIPLFKKAIDLAAGELEETDEDYLNLLGGIAMAYKKAGQYNLAEATYKDKIEIENRIASADNLSVAITIKNLADLYHIKGQYFKAEEQYKLAMEKMKELTGEESMNYALSINNLALFYKQTGNYEKAGPVYTRALQVAGASSADHLLDYSTILFNMGSFYNETGQYGKAEQYYTEAEQIRRELLTPSDPDYTLVLGNLATLYTDMGLYEKAIELYQQEIAFMSMNTEGMDSTVYAVSLNNIAAVYSLSGNYQLADQFITEANRIKRKYLGKTDISYIAGLHNQADLYALEKKFTEAEKLYKQVMSSFISRRDTLNGYYPTTLDAMGMLYIDMKQYEKAEPFFNRAKNIRKKVLGDTHPAYLNGLDHFIYLYLQNRQYEKAGPFILEQQKQVIRVKQETIFALSEKEKYDHLADGQASADLYNNYLYRFPGASPAIRKNNFNAQLFLKSLALAETRSLLEAIRQNKDTTVKAMYEEWASGKRYLAEQYTLPPAKRDPDLKFTEEQTEKWEKTLSVHLHDFGNELRTSLPAQEDIQAKMQSHEAAVEFVSFRIYNNEWTDSILYGAYILRKDDTVPAFVPLCPGVKLEKIFSGTRTASGIKSLYRSEVTDEDAPSSDGDSLYMQVWKPLEPHLSGITTIYYAPAGLLNRVAFHALPVGNDRLLTDKYDLHRYISTRELVSSGKDQQVNMTSAVLFADPAFSMDSIEMMKGTISNGAMNAGTVPVTTTRQPWGDLPGTATEMNSILSLFNAQGIKASAYAQNGATEEQLKSMSGNSPAILHLATHGFFLPDPEEKRKSGVTDNRNTFTIADDPMLRSGIVLAGANRAWSGKEPVEGREDGIVTAYEISQLDLSKTDLVVLSACETALGDIKGTEGVFGLQRAFKLAGVKYMLLSLWKVPDKETGELMTAFYKYYLGGQSPRQALNNAQKEMRIKYRPYYWAAFVLIE